jgi:hypothetical protein
MSTHPDLKYHPSPKAVEVLCERLQQMGVSISESSARKLLESVLAAEGPQLDAQVRATLEGSIESVRRAAEEALNALHGKASASPRRDYELSFPPAPVPEPKPGPVSGQRRKVSVPRPEASADEEPRPVFKLRRGR